jgi:hypothetical protein
MLDRLAPAHFAPLAALRALDVSNNQLASLDGIEALPNLHALVRGDSLLTRVVIALRFLCMCFAVDLHLVREQQFQTHRLNPLSSNSRPITKYTRRTRA